MPLPGKLARLGLLTAFAASALAELVTWQAAAPVEYAGPSHTALEVLNGNARSAACDVEVLLGFRHDAAAATVPSVLALLTVPGFEASYTWQVTVPNGWTLGLNLGNLPADASAAGLALALVDASTGISAPVTTIALPGAASCIARAAPPQLSPAEGGSFGGAVALMLGGSEPAATLRYSLSGATQRDATVFDGSPVVIAACGTTTVRAWASRPGAQDSQAVQVSYTINPVGSASGSAAANPQCVGASALVASASVSADGAVAQAFGDSGAGPQGASVAVLGGSRDTTCGVTVRLSFDDSSSSPALLSRSFLLVATYKATAQAAAEFAAAEAVSSGSRRLEGDVSAVYLNALLAQATAVVPVTLSNHHATDIALASLPQGSKLMLFASGDAASTLTVDDAASGLAAGDVDPFSFTLSAAADVTVPDACGTKLLSPRISASGDAVSTTVRRALQSETHFSGAVTVTVASSLPGSVVYVTTDGSDPRSSATALFSSLVASVDGAAQVTFRLTGPGCTAIRSYAASATVASSDESSATYCIDYAGTGGAAAAAATDLCGSGGDGIRCAPNNCGRLYYRCKGGVASPIYDAPAGFLCNDGELKGADDPTDTTFDPAAEGVTRCDNNLCGYLPAPRPGNAAAQCVLPVTGTVAGWYTVPSPSCTPTPSPCSQSATPSPCDVTHSPTATKSKLVSPSASSTHGTSCSATPTPSSCPYIRQNPPCSVTGDGFSCVRSDYELQQFADAVLSGQPVTQCTHFLRQCAYGEEVQVIELPDGVACYGGSIIFDYDDLCTPTVIPTPGCNFPSASPSGTRAASPSSSRSASRSMPASPSRSPSSSKSGPVSPSGTPSSSTSRTPSSSKSMNASPSNSPTSSASKSGPASPTSSASRPASPSSSASRPASPTSSKSRPASPTSSRVSACR